MRVAPGGWRRAFALFALALPALVVPTVALALALAGYAVLAFYRDPERTPPPSGIVSPADGRVRIVREEDGRVRVGIFMNVTDVHVNRAPLAGDVSRVDHRPGGHLPAFSKASERNERVEIGFADPEYDLALVAGTVARRITPYVAPGDRVGRGERVGHIAFGSRVDVVLPAGVDPDDVRVSTGERVRAGETVIAGAPDAAGASD
ncbi:MAG: protein sorting system archaetidylserine decarboxylase [Haloferacaceae archaeon]